MRAAWYDRRGPARDTLVVGEMPDPEAGRGEVRIAVSVSGLSPGDVKKRSGWQGAPMPFPRVIPHSDGAGIIDSVGPGVPAERVGRRVWCYGAQSYRPFGTAADYVVVPSALAVDLPAAPREHPGEFADQAACLGIAGITAHRSVFADGPVAGLTVLIHGAAGGVGSIATQLARRDGAQVLGVVRRESQRQQALDLGAHHVFIDAEPGLGELIRQVVPGGVHRISDVDFASHIDVDAEVVATGGIIAAYFSSADRPTVPYWALGFKDVTLRLLGSDDFPASVKAAAASTLTEALVDGSLRSTVARRVPLEDIVTAHELVEEGVAGRVLIDL